MNPWYEWYAVTNTVCTKDPVQDVAFTDVPLVRYYGIPAWRYYYYVPAVWYQRT